jgi:hypothetical protein
MRPKGTMDRQTDTEFQCNLRQVQRIFEIPDFLMRYARKKKSFVRYKEFDGEIALLMVSNIPLSSQYPHVIRRLTGASLNIVHIL